MTDDEAFKLAPRDSYLSYSKSLALGLVTLALIYLCAVIMKPFISILAWSLALAVASHPVSSWLHTRIRCRSIASLVTLAIAAIVVFLPALWLAHVLIEAAVNNFGEVVQRSGLKTWIDPVTAPPRLAPLLVWLDEALHLRQMTADFMSSIAQRLPQLVTTSLLGLIQFLLILFTSFFFIRDGEIFFSLLKRSVPLSTYQTERIAFRVLDTVHACLFGVVLMAILQGALGSAIFWWLELPQPALWGVVMGLLAVVPYLGAFIIWIPTAFFLALHGRWSDALVLSVWGAIVIGLADNLLYPILVGKRLHYHTLAIFLFLLGGVFVFGSSGIVLGPVILSLTHGILSVWQNEEFDLPIAYPNRDERPTVIQ